MMAEMQSAPPSEEEEEVMSEVHLGCPPNVSGPFISQFTFSLPPLAFENDPDPSEHVVHLDEDGDLEMGNRYCNHVENDPDPSEHAIHLDEDGDLVVARRTCEMGSRYRNHVENDPDPSEQVVHLDEDGDLVVVRRTKQSSIFGGVTIQHSIKSTIPTVGLQVWRAELVLADFVLHKILMSSEFNGVVAVELGAGTGLVGILLAHAAEAVFITDHGKDVLDNCAKNVDLNYGMCRNRCSVKVRELDWMKPWPPLDLELRTRYSWTSSDVEEIKKASMLLAADVIYSDELTDALFIILEKLMKQGSKKVLYLALEKRYNFSLNDFDIVANGYSHFLGYLQEEEETHGIRGSFVGKPIDLSEIPQYLREYERGDDVELWEIKYVR